jgi:20S proteasome alpha/beta subunit
MTLILSLQGKEGLVIAADSRGTIGDPRGLTAINDSHTKLFKLSDNCGVSIAGASELATKIIDELNGVLQRGKHTFTDPIMNETRKLVRSRYDDWFAKFKTEERPGMNLILAGYQRNQSNELVPRTYLLTSQLDFAPQMSPNGNMLAGVPQYAVYLMHRLYNPEMGVEALTRLAAYLISETATQDPKVGGPIKIASITPTEGFKEFASAEVDEALKLNDEQNEKLRKFFFEGVQDAQGAPQVPAGQP